MTQPSRQSRRYIALLALLALLLTGQVDGLHLHADDSQDGRADFHLNADTHILQADDHHAIVPVVDLGARDELRHHSLDDQPFAATNILTVVLPPIQGPPPTAQPPADFHSCFAFRLPLSRAPPLAS